ncbi:hypothetical protein ABRY95_13930 [Castellaniella ginsengisoli]|uniref:Uncharacterized protein n=1 Tax=Castellaniella ginsengisoli TaxID=546114 RepID=A0AB39GZR2_9BURK
MVVWAAMGAIASLIVAFYAGMAYHRSKVAKPCVLDAQLERRDDGDYLVKLLIHPGETPMLYRAIRVRGGEISRAEASWPGGRCVFTPVHGFSTELDVEISVPSDRLREEPVREWLILRSRQSSVITLSSRKSLWASKIRATVSPSMAKK